MAKAFLQGLMLLELMARSERESGVSELAQQLGAQKSVTHRLLQNLIDQGFARRNPETCRYELTMKLWELGAHVFNRLDIRHEALSFMRELADDTQETVHLSVLNGPDVLYVEKIDSPQPVRAYSLVGGRAPAQCVATGKAMLAWSTETVIDEVAQRLHAHTPLSITSKHDLLKELENVRTKGYAINKGEWREQVMGLAAPIRDMSGQVVAAMGISGPSERINLLNFDTMGVRLINSTDQISQRLGYHAKARR